MTCPQCNEVDTSTKAPTDLTTGYTRPDRYFGVEGGATGSNVPERCTSIEDAYAHHLSNGMDLFDRAYQDAVPYRAKFLAKTKFYRLWDIYAFTAADLPLAILDRIKAGKAMLPTTKRLFQ